MGRSLDLESIVDDLIRIRERILEADKIYHTVSRRIHSHYRYNTLNFLRYLKLRTVDLRPIQANLTVMGVSSLSHSERQVLANIENIIYLLSAQIGRPFRGKYELGNHPVNFIKSAKRLRRNTRRLFGKHVKKMGIMVTLSSEASDKEYLRNLMVAGMNIARINTAHDTPEAWVKFVENIRELCDEMGTKCSVYFDLAGPKIRSEMVWSPPGEEGTAPIRVEKDDRIYLIASLKGKTADKLKTEGKVIVTCSVPSIITDISVGEKLWFNDGKVGCVVEEKFRGGVKLLVKRTDPKGGKLRAEKGINLPTTELRLPSLSEEDLGHLDLITKYGDMIGYSFVRTPEDVKKLQDELASRDASRMGMVLKIENRQAFTNLPGLILQAMESPNIGIMTARGDLAVELGAERLSEVQEQIMWLCEAAMIPNIWATQVLESLTKKGNVSRAEITDAAMSVRAECVMLNKGPHIIESLHTLSNILDRMEKHLFKKMGTMRKLKVAEEYFGERPEGRRK